MDEAVGQLLHFGFGQDEAEVVAVVAAEGQRAVVLAEEGLALFAAWALGDVDVVGARKDTNMRSYGDDPGRQLTHSQHIPPLKKKFHEKLSTEGEEINFCHSAQL